MKKIVLLRHGESLWNMENRFTGWTDVDLTAKGEAEAYTAGEQLLADDFHFDKAYTSYLKRAVRTLNCVLDRLDQERRRRWVRTIRAIRASTSAIVTYLPPSCREPNL